MLFPLLDFPRTSKGKREFDEIHTTKDLLQYLWDNFALPHNMFFLQGLFLASGVDRLYQKCVEFSKSMKHEPITFFEMKSSMTGK